MAWDSGAGEEVVPRIAKEGIKIGLGSKPLEPLVDRCMIWVLEIRRTMLDTVEGLGA